MYSCKGSDDWSNTLIAHILYFADNVEAFSSLSKLMAFFSWKYTKVFLWLFFAITVNLWLNCMQPLVFMLMNVSYLSVVIFLTFHSFSNDVERIYLSRNLNDMQKNIWKLCNVSFYVFVFFCFVLNYEIKVIF